MQSIVVTLGYFPWALCRPGGISQCITSAYFLKWNTCIWHSFVPFTSWFSAAVLTNKFIPKLGHRKRNMKGQISSWSPEQNCCPGPEAPCKAELFLASCFAFSLAPGALYLASAWLQHSATERSTPCWLLLHHPLKGERLWGCCLVPRFPGLLLVWGAPQNDTGNLYLLALHSVTVLVRECLFICLYCTVFLEGRLFGPQKSHATRTCTYLIRG